MSPNAEGGGVAGCQPMRYTGAQINFGDLTPYLTYAFKDHIEDLQEQEKRCHALLFTYDLAPPQPSSYIGKA
jgi:hypothetical protein